MLDIPLVAGITVAADPNAETTCRDGTLTADAGGNQILYSGGTLAPVGADGTDNSCTISVNVTAPAVGTFINSTEAQRSSLGVSPEAGAELTVTAAVAPGFGAAFASEMVRVGDVSRLNFTVDNSANAVDVGARFQPGFAVRSCGGGPAQRVDHLLRRVRATGIVCPF